jgi:hypothetical protein
VRRGDEQTEREKDKESMRRECDRKGRKHAREQREMERKRFREGRERQNETE